MSIPAPTIYLEVAVLFAGAAAMLDLRTRRIPNLLTGPAIVLGLVLHFALGGFAQLALAALAGLLAGGLFLLFYLAGGMGGGDVKLITAIGCIVGSTAIKDVVLATVLIGAVLALALAAYHGRIREMVRNVVTLAHHHSSNGLVPHKEICVSSRATLRLPYALPIAAGTLFALCNVLSGLAKP
jgi:prepilin peptidase CpaA